MSSHRNISQSPRGGLLSESAISAKVWRGDAKTHNVRGTRETALVAGVTSGIAVISATTLAASWPAAQALLCHARGTRALRASRERCRQKASSCRACNTSLSLAITYLKCNIFRYYWSRSGTDFVTDSASLLRNPADQMPNRLAERREELGLTKTDAARLLKTSKQHYGRLESGETSLDQAWLARLAKVFKCRPVDLLPELGAGPPTAPLVGFVGAGEQVINFDDGVFDQVESPPGTSNVHVVCVRGDSMWPAYREGDLLFFEPTDTMDPGKCLYRDCIVQVLGGPTYVKRIIPGSDADTFTLTSYRAPELLGVKVQWASPVLWVKRS